jgi:hypothetical protein
MLRGLCGGCVFLTLDEFKAFVSQGEAKDFVTHRLFSDDCWIFSQPKFVAPGSTYDSLRRDLSNLLGLLPRQIAVVGSGKFGWSMSPSKGIRPFDPKSSDLDIAIESRTTFDESWRDLRRAYFAGISKYREMHAKHVFSRVLVLDGAERYRTEYLRDLATKLSNLNAVVNKHVRLEKPAQYRIYADWDDATNYHAHGLDWLRRGINNGDAQFHD